jgi:hypothetical protein
LTDKVDAVGETVTTMGAKIVTVAEADVWSSAADVAVTFTCAGLGTTAGAIYRPLESTIPHAAPTQPFPLTDQVTFVFVNPETVALNCCFPSVTTRADVGETLTLIVWVSVTVAESDCAESATEVAITFTKEGLGTVGGAVYKPVDEIEPQVEPAHPYPFKLHFTAVLLVPVTDAVNCFCAPVFNSALDGEMETWTVVGP